MKSATAMTVPSSGADLPPMFGVEPGRLPHPWRVCFPSPSGRMQGLTVREMRFLECLASGASNKDMAQRLFVTPNTVKFHLKNLYKKFGVSTRLQAVKAAQDLGLLTPPSNPATSSTQVSS